MHDFKECFRLERDRSVHMVLKLYLIIKPNVALSFCGLSVYNYTMKRPETMVVPLPLHLLAGFVLQSDVVDSGAAVAAST